MLCVVFKGKPTHHLVSKNEEAQYTVNKKTFGGHTKLADVGCLSFGRSRSQFSVFVFFGFFLFGDQPELPPVPTPPTPRTRMRMRKVGAAATL